MAGKPKSNIETVREFSAGGVVWRRNDGNEIEVVMVRPERKENWTLPKGQVEPGEKMEQTAVRECLEETGLTASIQEKLGEISYVYSMRKQPQANLKRIFKKVVFYLMRYESGETRPQAGEIAEVAWYPIDRALELSNYENERALIERARSRIS